MSNLLALTAREWKAFWYSPIAYVVGAFFLVLQGWVFWLLVTVLNDPRVDPNWRISQFFFGGTFFYWFSVMMIAPLLTMRTFSEEKRTGTLEVLLTAPVTDTEIVLSKFLGAWLSYGALWATTLALFVMMRLLTPLDWGPVLTGYLGTWLLGGLLIGIGVLASSLTRNQVIAAVMSFVLIILLFSVGFLETFFTDPQSARVIHYLSLMEHLRDFAKGIIDTRSLVYYLTGTAILLFLTVRTIGSSRWRT
jgi:ABC-2 type transport system permease protein